MTATLFDRSDEYDEMLNRGLSLTGEDKTYFLAGRVKDLRTRLPRDFAARRILDFGCGVGDSSSYLAEAFATAEIVGTDTAARALACATAKHESSRVHFVALENIGDVGSFDLCYVNGVFHHIDPRRRPPAVALIHSLLREGGYLALFENNPWNPATRLVMSRIPFDRDAVPLSAPETRALLRHGGFTRLEATRFLFYFPRALARLRVAEAWLTRLPLGAQYCVLGRK